MTETVLTRSTVFSRDMAFDGNLTVQGNLAARRIVATGDITVAGDLHARGAVLAGGSIKVGKSLDAGLLLRAGGDISAARGIRAGRIEAGGSLRAGAGITTTGAILACGGIAAGGAIEAAARIMAGEGIRTAASVVTPTFEIDCQRLATRELPFGRQYWAALPMLAPWRERILDPALCWDELRAMFSPADIAALCATRFGHWSLEAQFRMFLGRESAVVPPEAARRAPPRPPRITLPMAPASKPRRVGDGTNVLLQIVNGPGASFPDYTGNASYAAIIQALVAASLIGDDLRAVYTQGDAPLSEIYAVILQATVADDGVKQQLLAEVGAATAIRLLQSNMNDFITTTILADECSINTVGTLIRMEDDDAVTMDVGGILSAIVDGLTASEDAGTMFTVLGAIIEGAAALLPGDPGFETVDEAYAVLSSGLSDQFGKSITILGNIATQLLSDWGRMSAAHALILDGTLAWPVDDSAAVTAAANTYEISVFQAMLPIHWQPIFSYGDFARDTREGCNGTVWMQPGGWGAVNPQQAWVPYWMTYGSLWEADLTDAEQELANIGVSIQDLTMGTGQWGPQAFAYAMANPVGVDNKPSCVKKK